MKSLISLWKILAVEMANRCHTSATMDIKTVQGRYKHEGLSFLTIALPDFGKDLQKGLDQGLVDRDMFQGFSWHAGLPRFLGGFLDQVFDRSSGVLLDDPSIESIIAIRQLTLLYSKIEIPCTPEREARAMDGYVQCEQDVRRNDSMLDPSYLEEFRRVSNLLFRDVFTKLDRKIWNGELVPKHGPGATADKYRGNGKYRLTTWTARLEEVFDFGDFLFPSARYCEHFDGVDILEPGSEIPVKVITVPKTQKTPRIIAVEPACMQYMQQAVLEALLEAIAGDSIVSRLIGFVDQSINQDLAMKGSLDGSLATLDLSEASDRVSNQLIKAMLSNNALSESAVDATRSRKADVPGHGVIRLAKYASMGSALCFPFEAMVFLTMVMIGIQESSGTRFSKRSQFREYFDRVHIYGDDIIVPADHVFSVVDALELFGARVGAAKSFWTGRFRESCGKEYYSGTDVSITKFRRIFPSTRKHAPEVISLVSFRNQLYRAGCWETCRYLDSKIEKLLKWFPRVTEESSVLGRFSFLGYQTDKECEKLHSPLVKGYVVSTRLPRDPLEGHSALLKFFLKRGNLPFADRKHLERAGRPRAVDIKPRWASPF